MIGIQLKLTNCPEPQLKRGLSCELGPFVNWYWLIHRRRPIYIHPDIELVDSGMSSTSEWWATSTEKPSVFFWSCVVLANRAFQKTRFFGRVARHKETVPIFPGKKQPFLFWELTREKNTKGDGIWMKTTRKTTLSLLDQYLSLAHFNGGLNKYAVVAKHLAHYSSDRLIWFSPIKGMLKLRIYRGYIVLSINDQME